MISAQQLAKILKQQAAASGEIRVNDALLEITGLDDLIRRDLSRPDGVLILTVDASQIPDSPPNSGFTVGNAAVPAGETKGFLQLDNRLASITFAFGTTIEVTLTLSPQKYSNGAAAPWVLSTSFPELADQAYDQIELADTQLMLATATPQTGLALTSELTVSGVLKAIEDLLGLKKSTFSIAGDAARGDKGELSLSLTADLGIPTFGIDNIITLKNPGVAVEYGELPAKDGTLQSFSDISLVATVAFGSTTSQGAESGEVDLEVSVGMPISDNSFPILQLSVLPKDRFNASLKSLGSLVAGKSWDDFFQGPAAPLQDYFDTFGFIGYTMGITTSAKVSGLTLRVGTLSAWRLWNNYTLQLDAEWSVIFLGSNAAQTLLLHAGFDFDKKMQFDVDVYLPSVRITGAQSGDPITLDLGEVSDKLFDGAITVPADLLKVSVGNFWIDINKPSQTLGIGATASASISLFGAQLLAVTNMAISVTVDDSGQKKVYGATLDGQISLGPITAQVDAVLSSDKNIGCSFTAHLVDETVGSMLGHLVHLVDPTLDIRLDAPWDKLLDISLDALVLKVNITKKSVEIDYVQTIDLGFLTITTLGLAWQKNEGGPSATKITIEGSLIGISFGGDSGNPPLAWDPVNDNPPAFPGGGDKLLDLRYVAIGQHVGFDPSWQPENVEAVIAKLEELALPAGGSNIPNLTSKDGLRFRSDSGWLIGADFTVLGTVQLAFVFNDPSLYGLLISLSGARAKSFAGLKFEILYRKVTDAIGVYHIELKLPDVMRHLEFGEVSLTLPVIIVDIYTNGNFRIDLGFPKGMDFSNSFCLQIFPFLGYGGFYFALLNGDTSTRVPKITNGRFDPVIEFGVALSVGVGKTIDEGVLAGGLSVVVNGIVEGVIGWFNPTDTAIEKTEYYWLQGTISIVGRLYGSINFYVIQASLSVTAYASVTLVIEAHQPILISMSVGVSIEVSIKIVFFTIHCSFSATISASFAIGSATPTPWKIASGNAAPRRFQLFASRHGVHAAQHRMFAELTRHMRRELFQRRLDAGDISLIWDVRTVFPSPRALTVHMMPAFTKIEGDVAGVLLLGTSDNIPARAATLQAHVRPSSANPDPGIGDILEGLVRWAILNARATLGEADDTLVSYDDVTLLARAFSDDDELSAAIDYKSYLNAFLGANYRLTIEAPTPKANGEDAGVALLPMPPALTMTAGTDAPVNFAEHNALDATTLAKMQAYFELLSVNYEQYVAQTGAAPSAPEAVQPSSLTPMAEVAFEQYFAMLMRAAVKAAGDVMQRYPFRLDDASRAFGIAQIRLQLKDPGLPPMNVVSPNRDKSNILAQRALICFTSVRHQVAIGDSFDNVAKAFNAVLPKERWITGSGIANANAGNGALFQPSASISFSNLTWKTLSGESVDLVVARLYTRAAPQSFLQQLPGLQALAQAMLAKNPSVFIQGIDPIAALRTPIDAAKFPTLEMPEAAPFQQYSTAPGDTFISIAATAICLASNYVDVSSGAAWVLAHNTLPVTDPSQPLPLGTTIVLPTVGHELQLGESIEGLATLLLTDKPTVIAAILASPSTPQLLKPQAMLWLPPLHYGVREDDTLASIAALFNLTLDGLAEALDESPTAIFAPGAEVVAADVEQTTVDNLATALSATQWKTLAPMASRFMLSGLRLPDPTDDAFKKLTIEEMRDPQKLGAITTLPLYVQTGQQFAIATTPPKDYGIVLAPTGGAAWITNQDPVTAPLTAEQRKLIAAIASASFAPQVELDALPPFRLTPTRYTLQQHISWQPARLPEDAVYSPAKAGGVTGVPDLWMFPDALVDSLAANGGDQPPYAVFVGTHETAQAGMTVANARAYAWATAIGLSIQQVPADAFATKTAASIALAQGADDAGLALLGSLLAHLAKGDDAKLFLLYSPNPASSEGGLYSDDLDQATALVQTNLSTLSHSEPSALIEQRSGFLRDAVTGASTYVAPLSNASAFLQMLWECSIVRSGGYYIRYAPAGGGALPPSLFTNGPTAEITLLVVLNSQNANFAKILPFNNCAIVGDNVDPASSNVFVQPAAWLVPRSSSLTDAAAYALNSFGLEIDVATIAELNASIPQLLRPGAVVAVPGAKETDAIRIDDTLATLAARNHSTPRALATFGANATAAILTPTGLIQFTANALSRATAMSAGAAGFQFARANPDPGNQLKATEMDGEKIVAELFHMVTNRVATDTEDPWFFKSGEGVPTGPAQSAPTENGGNPPPDTANDRWDYHQAVAIAPFARSAFGSASPALPPAAQNPYAGVGPETQVTLAFSFADPYGNELQSPPNARSLVQPVRYFDELVGIARWPSAAASYSIGGDGSADPTVTVEISIHVDKYTVSPSLSAERAGRNAATDRLTYMRAYYQLAQPDVSFAISTTLEPPVDGKPVSHLVDAEPFRSFVTAAYLALDSICASRPAVFTTAGGETIGSVAETYNVALADLFVANGESLYSAVFGTTRLQVPELYSVVDGDSLASIVAKANVIDVAKLVNQNPWAPLNTTIDLATPTRSVTPKAKDSLASIASANQCSVSGLAMANLEAALTDGLVIAVAGVTEITRHDTFKTLVDKFTQRGIVVTAGEIAIANQTIEELFPTPITLKVDDIVPATHDSLGTLQQRFGFSLDTLASLNLALPNVFAAGASLYVGPGTTAVIPAVGTTLSQFAQNNQIPLPALGLALWNGLAPASPANVNSGAPLAAKGALTIPATIVNAGQSRYAPYRAQDTDIDIATIAAKFLGNDPGRLGELNVDLFGLFVPGTRVVDAASGTSEPTTADSTFLSLVDAFKRSGHPVTPRSLARDNAKTANLVRLGALWIAPPQIAIALRAGEGDSLARIAGRYGQTLEVVARTNAGVLGFLATGVALPAFNGIEHTTRANETLNSLLSVYTPPGGAAPAIDALAAALKDVAMITPDALILPAPIAAATTISIAAKFETPLTALGVTVVESRTPEWVAEGFASTPDVAATKFAAPPQSASGESGLLALDAFANALETALPGVRVATGASAGDEPGRGALWIVNFSNQRGPKLEYAFEPASALRSFAIPPLSTSLASGKVPVTPYVSGKGLSGDALNIVFAGIDLDAWGATFLAAMDQMLAPVYAVPAQEVSLTDFDKIVSAKQTLAKAISARLQYVLAGGGPGAYDRPDPRRRAAIDSMRQALLVQLGNAYTIESVVQAALDVESPYPDAELAPRLSGKATLAPDKGSSAGDLKNASLSTAKIPLAATTSEAPATASFLLTVQTPTSARSITATIKYEIAEIEVPSGPPNQDGYQPSSWLKLIHPLSDRRGRIVDVTLPIPLRAYPRPPSLLSQQASASYQTPINEPAELAYWDASAIWAHDDADQDAAALLMDVGISKTSEAHRPFETMDVEALFGCLAQFITVWPALSLDLALLPSRTAQSPSDPVSASAISAFADMAEKIAAAWPNKAYAPTKLEHQSRSDSAEVLPGTYGYTLIRPFDGSSQLTTVTAFAAEYPMNPMSLWPDLAVDDGSGAGMRLLTLESKTPAEATYSYPKGVPKGRPLKYQVTLRKLDAVRIADFDPSVSIVRNANLVSGAETSPLFVYRTPFTGFASALVPLVTIEEDFDIGGGPVSGLGAALAQFLGSFLNRPEAPKNAICTIRIAASYGYELSRVAASGSTVALRGAKSGSASGDERLVPLLPVAFVPSVQLSINDEKASITKFSEDLGNFIMNWDEQVKPSHANAAIFLDLSLFSQSSSSYDRPLVMINSLRYALK